MSTKQRVADLFAETGHAHHQAFIETDGEDPEWPLWYAEYLHERLPNLLGVDITKGELASQLIRLSEEQPRIAPETPWNEYYAAYFIDRFDALDDAPDVTTE